MLRKKKAFQQKALSLSLTVTYEINQCNNNNNNKNCTVKTSLVPPPQALKWVVITGCALSSNIMTQRQNCNSRPHLVGSTTARPGAHVLWVSKQSDRFEPCGEIGAHRTNQDKQLGCGGLGHTQGGLRGLKKSKQLVSVFEGEKGGRTRW